jgi:hypothetical protein
VQLREHVGLNAFATCTDKLLYGNALLYMQVDSFSRQKELCSWQQLLRKLVFHVVGTVVRPIGRSKDTAVRANADDDRLLLDLPKKEEKRAKKVLNLLLKRDKDKEPASPV